MKIESDTPDHPVRLVSKETISQLIYQNMENLKEIILVIEKLVKEEKKRLFISEEVFRYFDTFHFTQSNRHRFLQAYRKWKSAFPSRKLTSTLADGNSASELISSLENELLIESKNWKLS